MEYGSRSQFDALLRREGESAFADLFAEYSERLWRLLQFRLDPRLRSRVDPDDALQETYLAAVKRISAFLDSQYPTLYLWLRDVALQTLSRIHRFHLQTEKRTVAAETDPQSFGFGVSDAAMQVLIASVTGPSQGAIKEEMTAALREGLQQLSDNDREVIELRHFEELVNIEVAHVLEIEPAAASARYIRALDRLRNIVVQSLGAESLS